jgi:hypothetical protein
MKTRLEAVLKHQIAPKYKAWADENTQHTKVCEYFEEAHNTVIGR